MIGDDGDGMEYAPHRAINPGSATELWHQPPRIYLSLSMNYKTSRRNSSVAQHIANVSAQKIQGRERNQYADYSSYELYVQLVTCISRLSPWFANRRSTRNTSLVTAIVDSERTNLSPENQSKPHLYRLRHATYDTAIGKYCSCRTRLSNDV